MDIFILAVCHTLTYGLYFDDKALLFHSITMPVPAETLCLVSENLVSNDDADPKLN